MNMLAIVGLLSYLFCNCSICPESRPLGRVLAEAGRPQAEIVLAERASKVARFAALELKAHLDLMTGADFRIVGETGRTSGVYPIFVGPQQGTREHDVAALCEQEHVVDVSAERTILLGRERPSDMPVELVYESGSVTCVRKCLNKPTMWEPRGSLNAVYDFLHDRCGVSWTTCTEAGSCVPRKDSLSVACGVTRYSPFLKGREVQLSPEEWADFRNPEQYARYLSVAYPWASAQGDAKRKVQLTKELFVLRLKAGGERRIANHSFYGYYDRFLNRNSKAFEGYHPEYFSRHRLNKKADRAEGGEIFAPVDTAHKPAQLCYSNEKLIEQVIRDARAYFDRVAANEKAGLPPSAHWGRDTFCLEPMDNGQFCECDACLKLRRPDRKELRAEMSDYWFTFVNRIARAVKESHPGRKVSTLAYGTAREGMPSFPVEDNVTVHFCWSDNRSPHLNPLDGRQMAALKAWRAKYPDLGMGVWLYNGFPHESGTWLSYVPYPGFFASLFGKEMKLLKQLNVREMMFNCGLRDDFEYFLGLRWMWDPDLPLDSLKQEFFSAYGPAASAIRRFYECVEARYCDVSLYEGAAIPAYGRGAHPNPYLCWGRLGTDEHLAELGRHMEAAEAAVNASGSDLEKLRVRNWREGVYEYMRFAKRPTETFKTGIDGVSLIRREAFCAPIGPFDGKDVLAGRPLRISVETPQRIVTWENGKFVQVPNVDTNAFYALTTDPGFRGYMQSTRSAVYRCDVKIGKLRRFSIKTRADYFRSKFFFNLVGWRKGEKVMLAEGLKIAKPFCVNGPKDAPASEAMIDVIFDEGTAPTDLEAIALEERAMENDRWWPPRYERLYAEEW